MDKFNKAYNEAVIYAESIEGGKYEYKIWKKYFIKKFGELVVEEVVQDILECSYKSKSYEKIVESIYYKFDMRS